MPEGILGWILFIAFVAIAVRFFLYGFLGGGGKWTGVRDTKEYREAREGLYCYLAVYGGVYLVLWIIAKIGIWLLHVFA